ncbi:HCO3 transporter family-domain-containing protein [Annulohypoxylon truncatum]|uniref:HCO3 transporter family-domain-containing protein n=1 Tax=Annulohypoxylon truncatum TaxID=327061 RepID=UPI0020076F4B|nr:HCO3 transporter family-domain-containing protein [Annulohypoxylon truncatum]KAI1215074.1 HCO3 transporter family-domain-containing protein [Annulohypoxylon truncatum]
MSQTADSLTFPTAMHSSGGSRGGTAEPGGAGAGAGAGSSPSGHIRRWVNSLLTSRNTSATLGHGGTEQRRRGASQEPDGWWKIRLFRGMVNDLRRRAPYYWSDWRDAWDYRVVPSTVYMYFANILPALAFSLDMFTKTNMQYGVNEVLLASVLGAVVFAILACQPLVIVGVTGPITVFNYTVYDIMTPTGTNYLAFMTWIGLWSLVFHWILAVTNACNWLRYVTRFPCDIFGFYVAFIYLQKGVQVLERFGDDSPFYLSVMVALLVFMIAYACGELGESPLFRHPVRVFLKDYGTPLTVIFFTGFVHLGRMKTVELERLPTSAAFFPTADRGWLVHFWEIDVGDVFIAIPFAVLLTILFYFDHNVSSLIAQGTEFPLRKPAGFHWDLFLLGLTTGVAGLLGLPFPNGLIPQAPFHTESLCVTKVVADTEETNGEAKGHYALKRTHVVEQRVSNLAQGLLTLGTMTGPLLVVLHLIPQAVLAGLFFIMGYQALEGNGITAKLLFLLRDRALTPGGHPLAAIRRRAAVWAFVGIEIAAFGATFAITQTVAAVGFPVVILALIPVRALLLPRVFTPQELGILDAPTASPFTMESVGGSYAAEGVHGHGHGAGEGTGTVTEFTESGSEGVVVGPTGAGAEAVGRRKSEEVLAEEGRGRVVEDVGIEMSRLGVSRRGQASRSVARDVG